MSSKGNSSKRLAQDQANLTGREKRRAKSRESRKIGNHPPRQFQNVLAKDAPRISGNLNATDFVAARLQEVKAMQSAIKSASNAITSLTFQSLPRHMRRRAASHNINRLPAHLRARAAREMEQSPPNKRKHRRGKRPPKESNVALEFERRSKENKWLETHMWHTKRMQMSNIWGYRLATRPNIKSARSIYRSFQHLAVIHDASYMGCIELTGSTSDIVRVMDTMTDCSLPSVGSVRYMKGSRAGKTFLYEYLGYPTKLICPLQFLWRPSKNNNEQQQRTMWLWIHPSCFAEAYNTIQVAVENVDLQESVNVRDLRDAFATFMLSGPRSTAMLQAILAPVEESSVAKNQDTATAKAAKVWRQLAPLRSSSSLAPGTVIGLTVQDPRLKFPQKPASRTSSDGDVAGTFYELLQDWPEDVSESLVWDEETRKQLNEHKLSDYQLTKRREQNLVPGTKLEFTEQDAQIPLLLLQRGSAENGLSRQDPCTSELFEGWTLIVPRGWGLAFWKSFMFAGARATGIEDVHAMHYESGQPCFPYDYIGARACENIRSMKKLEEEAAWSRRPPAKRLNFAKLGIERPFEADFNALTNTPKQQEQEMTDDDRAEYYLVQNNVCVSLILQADTFANAESAYQSHIASMYSKRNLTPPMNLPRLDVALFKIRLEYLDRGRPESNAMIYLISDQADYERHTYYIQNRRPGCHTKRKVLSELETEQSEQDIDVGDEDEKMTDAKPCRFPPSSDHIGFLTTAAFSFDAGCGVGVGACTVPGILRAKQLDTEHQRKIKMVVLVRNMKALQCRPAQLQVLS